MKTELVDQFFDKCRKAGLNVTPQRLAVYKALLELDNHSSPDDIYHHIKKNFPTISFATVYKILETLEAKKIISKVTMLHNTLRYDPMTKRHHHAICIKCKQIMDIENKDLDSIKVPANVIKGNRLVNFSVHFNVVCSACLEE